MPNVLAGRRIVPEWLQSDATPSRLAETVGNILSDPSLGAAQQSAFSHVIHGLGGPGAGIRAARVVERELRSRRPDLFSEAT
jgi:lipid-A-disaccharide synthase